MSGTGGRCGKRNGNVDSQPIVTLTFLAYSSDGKCLVFLPSLIVRERRCLHRSTIESFELKTIHKDTRCSWFGRPLRRCPFVYVAENGGECLALVHTSLRCGGDGGSFKEICNLSTALWPEQSDRAAAECCRYCTENETHSGKESKVPWENSCFKAERNSLAAYSRK